MTSSNLYDTPQLYDEAFSFRHIDMEVCGADICILVCASQHTVRRQLEKARLFQY